jgi:hypothetical protein
LVRASCWIFLFFFFFFFFPRWMGSQRAEQVLNRDRHRLASGLLLSCWARGVLAQRTQRKSAAWGETRKTRCPVRSARWCTPSAMAPRLCCWRGDRARPAPRSRWSRTKNNGRYTATRLGEGEIILDGPEGLNGVGCCVARLLERRTSCLNYHNAGTGAGVERAAGHATAAMLGHTDHVVNVPRRWCDRLRRGG